MKGQELIDQMCTATGLPGDLIQKELITLMNKAGKNPDDISMSDLRAVIVEYLQEVLLEAKDTFSEQTEA